MCISRVLPLSESLSRLSECRTNISMTAWGFANLNINGSYIVSAIETIHIILAGDLLYRTVRHDLPQRLPLRDSGLLNTKTDGIKYICINQSWQKANYTMYERSTAIGHTCIVVPRERVKWEHGVKGSITCRTIQCNPSIHSGYICPSLFGHPAHINLGRLR